MQSPQMTDTSSASPMPETILVTGATGYIGGRLAPLLLERGHPVRVMVRSRSRVLSRLWSDGVEIAVGDALKPETLPAAMQGVHTAYYLIHSIAGPSGFEELDLKAARNFGQAAKQAGVRRIIYLGGLGDPQADLSPHLRSRQNTGESLRESDVSVTEFRAAVIVGSGSISFEMIRHLAERLPVMVCPKWVYSRIQPIAIDDLLEYLVSALNTPESIDRTIEIGGADVTTYRGLMLGYARARGLRRRLIPVPVLTPRLSSYWVHWMTPIPAKITRALVEGLRNEVVVTDDLSQTLFPHVKPRDYSSSIDSVIRDLDEGRIDTSWSDASDPSDDEESHVRIESRQGVIIESRRRPVNAPPEAVYKIVSGIGGRRGWFFANWTWSLRGMVDRLLGGAGLRRGRRHPDELRVGDAIDFWRVESLEPDRLIRLKAEMRLPGRAWLQYEIRESPNGTTQLEQAAAFIPKGLPGLLYWYWLYPVHTWIFSGLIKAIARRAENP